jgi:type I restriction enzyme M protein
MTGGVGRHVLKKSDLYSSLWKSCGELRGGMDASQYKDYILALLDSARVLPDHMAPFMTEAEA